MTGNDRGRLLAIGAVVVLGTAVLLLAVRRTDVSGSYVGAIGGRPNGTTLVVQEQGQSALFTFSADGGLTRSFSAQHVRGDRFVLVDAAAGDKNASLEAHRTRQGLEVVGYVVPVGRVRIVYERQR